MTLLISARRNSIATVAQDSQCKRSKGANTQENINPKKLGYIIKKLKNKITNSAVEKYNLEVSKLLHG